jgi:hypothetical protein
MADNKFYRDSDIITDSNFVGKFWQAGVATPGSLIIEAGTNKHYIATYRVKQMWFKVDAVLFRLGTNTLVDIHRLADSGEKNNSGEDDQGFNLISGLLLDCPHHVFRVIIKDNQIEYLVSNNDSDLLFKPPSEMKTSLVSIKLRNSFSVVKFTGSTEELRNFLIKQTSNGDSLKTVVAWIRSDK